MTREEAIKILQELWKYKETDKYIESEIRQALEMAIKALEQEPKMGHWIEVHPLQEDDGGAYMCSKCRCGHPYIAPHWKYCPNCGAEMTERGEE